LIYESTDSELLRVRTATHADLFGTWPRPRAGIGVFLSLPREVTTAFDPSSHRVVPM
jgi:hypothetical protein